MQTPRSSFCTVLLFCVLPFLVRGDATSDLAAVQEAFFEWNQQQSPEYLSTIVGIRAYNDRLANYSLDVFHPQLVAVQQFISTTQAIDRSQVKRQHQYSYDTFLDTLNTFASNYDWRHYGPLNPINFLEGFFLEPRYVISRTPFDTKEDFEKYIARLQAYPTQVNQMMERMDKAIEMGTTNHNVSMRPVPDQISKVISESPVNCSFYGPFTTMLDAVHITQAERDDLRLRAVSAVQNMHAALGRLKSYIEDTYMPNTRSTYGVGGLPSGSDYYKACLKWHLSVDLSPEEVHQIGLREVDRITQLMTKVTRKQGFSGTVNEYYNMLKADPRFQMNSAHEILNAYQSIIDDRIKPKVSQLFRDIPPNQIEVQALPFDGPAMYTQGSEDGTKPGTFYANVMRPNNTKSFTMTTLTLHETLPGHHLQFVFQLNSDSPMFQKYQDNYMYFGIPYKFPFYTAFTEGWGLYGEFLGEEMGVFQDDYERMGYYGAEIFRACRLVVDTGLHSKGWSREQAVRYIAERTPMSLPSVEIEINRYITWPGQACAYKIGELKIKELRKKATIALGSKFDIRDFHSVVLARGKVPLSVLEAVVNDYIADHTSGTSSGIRLLSTTSPATCLLLALLLYAFWHQ